MMKVCVLLALIAIEPAISKDIFDITTRLDDLRFRFLFHTFREFVFNTIGKTGQKTRGSFLQEKFPNNAPFPCDVSLGRSKTRPNSIHKLRVGGKSAVISSIIVRAKEISLTFCVQHNGLMVKLSCSSCLDQAAIFFFCLKHVPSRK
jgi:hypothetical protein